MYSTHVRVKTLISFIYYYFSSFTTFFIEGWPVYNFWKLLSRMYSLLSCYSVTNMAQLRNNTNEFLKIFHPTLVLYGFFYKYWLKFKKVDYTVLCSPWSSISSLSSCMEEPFFCKYFHSFPVTALKCIKCYLTVGVNPYSIRWMKGVGWGRLRNERAHEIFRDLSTNKLNFTIMELIE